MRAKSFYTVIAPSIIVIQLFIVIALLWQDRPNTTITETTLIDEPEPLAAPIQKVKGKHNNASLPPQKTAPAQLQQPAQMHQTLYMHVWNRLQTARYIEEGTSKTIAYVFYDYLCPGCTQLNDAVAPYIEAGDITIRWIPVSIFPESKTKASIALLPDDQAARLRLHQVLRSSKKPANELLTTLPPEEKLLYGGQLSVQHLSLLIQLGSASTPTVMYQTNNGFVAKPITSKISVKQMVENAI